MTYPQKAPNTERPPSILSLEMRLALIILSLCFLKEPGCHKEEGDQIRQANQ